MNDAARIQQAMHAIQAGRNAEGIAVAREIAPSSPVYPQALHLMGVASTQLGNPAEGLPLLREALERGDPSPSLLTNIAVTARACGKIDAPLIQLLQQKLVGRRPIRETLSLIFPLLNGLGFHKSSTYDNLERIHYGYALPMLRWSLAQGAFDHALALEVQCYEHFVKQRETEDHFRQKLNEWVPDMLAAGRRLRIRLPPLPAPVEGGRQRIGFFIHNASTLAHIEALINVLDGYQQLADKPFDPIIYCFGGEDAAMQQRFRQIGVPVILLDKEYPETKDSFYSRLTRLRDRLHADGVSCLVWVSLAIMMPLAFAMRVAPVQIWWSMKYHGLGFDEIDGYVTSGSFSRTEIKQGRVWRAGRLQVSGRHDPSLRPEADAIVAQYRPAKILGTLARHELIRSPRFLDAVIAILQRNPNAIFLWTGREEAADISGRFRDAGVIGQTRFLGWVNIKVYAQVLDVFLDTFPFGCGFTVLDTMAAGTPAVFMAADPQSEDPSYDRILWSMIDGKTGTAEDTALARGILADKDGAILFQHAIDSEDYVARATRLLHDSEYAKAVGDAEQRFMDAMMSNPSQSARDFVDHFMAVIAERRALGYP
ncbi:MAG: hypothetical protein ACOY4U_07150 [Pseudomonadota bacterium]